MEDDNKLRMRLAARAVVKNWENTFLKPDAKTFICQRLKTSHERKRELLSEQDFPMPEGVLETTDQIWMKTAYDQSLEISSASSPECERLLRKLSLDKRSDLFEIANCFSEYRIVVEIRSDCIIATSPTGNQCSWKIVVRQGNVVTIASWGRTEIRPFGFSQFGPVTSTSHDALLWEAYAFLALVADISSR